MKVCLSILIFLLISFSGKTQLYFPPITGSTWETIDPLSLGYCQENIDELNNYLEQTNSKAFILLKNGKIVFEKYFGTFTKDSLYVWNSAGKTLTAYAVGIAQNEGFLQLSDTSSNYLGQGWTSLTPQQEEKITIWNQLTMTSGLNHTGDHYCTEPSCLTYIAEPGTRWMYHNGPYTLLDGVIEAATGMNLNSYVNQKIRTKIGMNGFYYQAGYNNVNLSNARSMARFGLLMLANGTWNGTPVLNDPNYIQEMTNSSQNLNPSYGYLTWLNGKNSYMIPSPDVQFTINQNALQNAPIDTYAALGKNGQIINVVPSQNLVFIRMGDHDGTSLIGNEYNDSIWEKINKLPCQLGLNEQFSEINISPNPVKDFLSISLKEKVTSIGLIDVNGAKIEIDFKAISDKKYQANLVLLPSGIYFLELVSKDKVQRVKIIKN